MPLTTLQRRLVGEERIGLVLAAARSEEVIERAKAEIVKAMVEISELHEKLDKLRGELRLSQTGGRPTPTT